MNNINLSAVKKLEIIIEGEYQEFVIDVLERAGATGFTIIGNLSGKGSHGFHEGQLMFNEDEVSIMIITVVPEEKVSPIIEGLTPFFNKHFGVVFISDIQVSRLMKFQR